MFSRRHLKLRVPNSTWSLWRSNFLFRFLSFSSRRHLFCLCGWVPALPGVLSVLSKVLAFDMLQSCFMSHAWFLAMENTVSLKEQRAEEEQEKLVQKLSIFMRVRWIYSPMSYAEQQQQAV